MSNRELVVLGTASQAPTRRFGGEVVLARDLDRIPVPPRRGGGLLTGVRQR